MVIGLYLVVFKNDEDDFYLIIDLYFDLKLVINIGLDKFLLVVELIVKVMNFIFL